MERLHFRSTSLADILGELRERELLREARPARRQAPSPEPLARTGTFGLSILGRRILG
jgi:hypothetical protein